MSIAPLDQTQLLAARQIDALLGEAMVELRAAADPRTQARRKLGFDANGWARAPYNAAALAAWQEMLQRSPDDTESLHHLAIMHHARAFELETMDATQSNGDWESALQYWHRLWQLDAFWDRIAEIVTKGGKRDDIDALRSKFPCLVLQVHYDIAFDPYTLKNCYYRAKYHVGLAASSPFPPAFLAKVKEATYLRFIESIHSQAWNPMLRDPGVILPAVDRIKTYVGLDPHHVPALKSALQLQSRLLPSWLHEYTGGDQHSPKQQRLLQDIKALANEWRPCFDRLAADGTKLEELVREQLCAWYRMMGDVMRFVLGQPADALPYYQTGAQVEPEDESDRRQCAKGLVMTQASLACDKAKRGDADARAHCDRVADRPDLSAEAHIVLVNAYLALGDIDRAEALCARGIATPPRDYEVDLDELSEHEDHLKKLREGQVSIRAISRQRGAPSRAWQDVPQDSSGANWQCEMAKTMIGFGQYAESIELLDAAERSGPRHAIIYFLRFKCRLMLDQVKEARRDLDRFEACPGHGPEERQAAHEVRPLLVAAWDRLMASCNPNDKEAQESLLELARWLRERRI